MEGRMNTLDQVITNQKAGLILIGAGAAVGKTNFALNLVHHKIQREHASILYFNLEEGRENIVERLIALQAKVKYNNLMQGRLTEKEWQKVRIALKEMKNWKLYLEPSAKLERMEKQIRKVKQEKELQYVMIDTWNYISRKSEEPLSREDEVEKIAKELKELAKELQICIICTSHIARRTLERKDHNRMIKECWKKCTNSRLCYISISRRNEKSKRP